MPFAMNNKPPTYWYVVRKSFQECINLFMKIFLDNHCFQQYEYSFGQLWLCFLMCHESVINLNMDKHDFIIFWINSWAYGIQWR
jgi:hypothetical protein